jgi:hypothetical protein
MMSYLLFFTLIANTFLAVDGMEKKETDYFAGEDLYNGENIFEVIRRNQPRSNSPSDTSSDNESPQPYSGRTFNTLIKASENAEKRKAQKEKYFRLLEQEAQNSNNTEPETSFVVNSYAPSKEIVMSQHRKYALLIKQEDEPLPRRSVNPKRKCTANKIEKDTSN